MSNHGLAFTIGMSVGAGLALLGVLLIAASHQRRPAAQRPSGVGNYAELIAVSARFRYQDTDITDRTYLDPEGWRPFRYGFLYANTISFQAPCDIPNPADVDLVIDWFDLDDAMVSKPFAALSHIERGDTCTVTQLDMTSTELRRRRP